MKTRIFLLSAATLALCLAGQQALRGGDKKKEEAFPIPKPGPQHKLLAKLTGTYDAKVKSWFGPEANESTGTLVRKTIMNGLYINEQFLGEFMGMKFQGMGLVGYDVNKKKYVMGWIDNFGTGISTNYGTYDADAKSWTFVGEEDNPAMGGKMKTRDVLKVVSEDEQFFEMFRTPVKKGKEFKIMEITYTRKKK